MTYFSPPQDCFSVAPLDYSYPSRGPGMSTCMLVGLAVVAAYLLMTPPAYHYSPRTMATAMFASMSAAVSPIASASSVVPALSHATGTKMLHGKGATAQHARDWMAANPSSVVVVFAWWCGHCKEMLNGELPEATRADPLISVLLIDSDALPADAWTGEAALCELTHVPMVMVLDHEGKRTPAASVTEAVTAVAAKKDGVSAKVVQQQPLDAEEVVEGDLYEALF